MSETKDKKLQRVIARLKAAQRKNSKHYRKGVPADKITAHLPTAWREVLQVSEGFEVHEIESLDGDSVSMDQVKELLRNQKPMLKDYQALTGKKPEDMIYIGNTLYGNMFFLQVKSKEMPPDCSVVMIDHETGEVAKKWPAIPDMLDELLPE